MQRSHSVYALLLFILTIALDYAITHKLTPFISMQNHYSLCYREEEREMAPLLEDLGVGMIPWSPLARGFLTRPALAGTTRATEDPYVSLFTSLLPSILTPTYQMAGRHRGHEKRTIHAENQPAHRSYCQGSKCFNGAGGYCLEFEQAVCHRADCWDDEFG